MESIEKKNYGSAYAAAYGSAYAAAYASGYGYGDGVTASIPAVGCCLPTISISSTMPVPEYGAGSITASHASISAKLIAGSGTRVRIATTPECLPLWTTAQSR